MYRYKQILLGHIQIFDTNWRWTLLMMMINLSIDFFFDYYSNSFKDSKNENIKWSKGKSMDKNSVPAISALVFENWYFLPLLILFLVKENYRIMKNNQNWMLDVADDVKAIAINQREEWWRKWWKIISHRNAFTNFSLSWTQLDWTIPKKYPNIYHSGRQM